MENPKSIGNVNVLNMVNATEASVAGIESIGNINFALVTAETVPLLQRIQIKNLNATMEVPSGCNLVTQIGQFTVSAEYFKNVEKKVFFLMTGQMLVEPGIPVDEIENGLAGLAVTGQFICPEDRMGAFNAKPFHVTGQTTTYPPFKHMVSQSLALDAAYLDSLEDGAEITVIGNLSVPKVLDNALLERKIGKIYVSGGVTCHEENAQALRSRLYKFSNKFKTIPAGYEWIQKSLEISQENLEYLPGARLFFKELVQISADVDPQVFGERIERIIAEDLLLCPKNLKQVLADRCDLFETKTVFYEDELWLVQNEQTLREARFERLGDHTATLVVTGELSLDAAISPATLDEKLSRVHNRGLIRCTPDQHAAIESHLGMREGEIEEVTPGEEKPQEEEPQNNQINNINYLVL